MSQFQFDQDSGGVYNPFEAASTEQAARDAVQGLQLPLASPGKRLLGSIIDSLLGALAVLPGLVIMGAGVFSAFSAAGGPGGNMGMPPGGFVEGEFPGVVMEGPGADGSAGSTGELSVPPTGDFGAGGGGGFTGPGPAPGDSARGCWVIAGWHGSHGAVGADYLRPADLPVVHAQSVGRQDLYGDSDCGSANREACRCCLLCAAAVLFAWGHHFDSQCGQYLRFGGCPVHLSEGSSLSARHDRFDSCGGSSAVM